MMVDAAIKPEDAVVPSHAVAVAAGRILHDLAGLRASQGEAAAELEAMAMLNASSVFLRPRLGEGGIERIVALIRADAERIRERDDGAATIGRKRAAQAAKRGAAL